MENLAKIVLIKQVELQLSFAKERLRRIEGGLEKMGVYAQDANDEELASLLKDILALNEYLDRHLD